MLITLTNYFAHYAFKSFQNYISKACDDWFIITPCAEDEICKIISECSNNKYKYKVINNIPLKVLKLIKQSVSNHLSQIFYLFFSPGIFPERPKTAPKRPKKGLLI